MNLFLSSLAVYDSGMLPTNICRAGSALIGQWSSLSLSHYIYKKKSKYTEILISQFDTALAVLQHDKIYTIIHSIDITVHTAQCLDQTIIGLYPVD